MSGWDLTRGLGTRLTIISAGRRRPYPRRPRGQAFNGLANSIWAGTKNPAASVKWVEYLASAGCQDLAASKGVVFPANKSSSEKAAAAFKAKGRRQRLHPPMSRTARVSSSPLPITHNPAKVYGLMHPAMDAVISGTKDAPAP